MATKIFFIYVILFVTAALTFSCESTRKSTSQKEQFKAVYLNEFKLTYFRQLLAKSYNNSKAVREIISIDHSGFTEPILTVDDRRLIDSLTALDNEHLKVDSSKGNRRAEGTQGKRPLGFIMQKLAGKWLDSLAKQRLKQSGVPESWTE